MKLVDYVIQDKRYTGRDGFFRGYDVTIRDVTSDSSRIIRTVKPPRCFMHETTIFLRQAWEEGLHYFPTLWAAPAGLYNNPVVVICAASTLLVVEPHKGRQPTKSFDTATFIAIIEDEHNEPQAWAFHSHPGPSSNKILGIFRRCT